MLKWQDNDKYLLYYVPFVFLLHILAQNLIFEMPFVSKFRFLITLPKIEMEIIFLDIVYPKMCKISIVLFIIY